MQLNSVYLYPNKLDVFTNVGADWLTERYRRVYNRNLKIYRGVDNRIDFQVRNSDQKAANVGSSYLVFNIVQKENKDTIFSKDCTIQSAAQGRAHLTILEGDLESLESGFYEYSLIQETRVYSDDQSYYTVSSRKPFYVDSQYGTIGTLEIDGDLRGDVTPSVLIEKFDYVNPASTGYTDSAYYISSIIDAKRQITTPNSLHTFQIYYSNNYQGKITIQGSLDESATPENWFDVPDANVTPGNNIFEVSGEGVTYKNVVGKYNWLRVKTGSSINSSAKFGITQTNNGTYNVVILDGGKDYQVGNQLVFTGKQLGGIDGTNDLTVTVTSVNLNGSIVTFNASGVSDPGFRNYVLGPSNPITIGKVDKVLYR